MASIDLEWPRMALHGLEWPQRASNDKIHTFGTVCIRDSTYSQDLYQFSFFGRYSNIITIQAKQQPAGVPNNDTSVAILI